MKSFASLFKIQFLDGIQYKAAAISGILTQFAWGFINIILFQLLSNGRMPKDQIASYFWLNQMFIALLAIWTMDLSVFRDIENGDIQYRLLRPMNLYLQWFINGAAYRLSRTIIRALPLFLICILLPNPYRLVLPNSFQALSLFSISILLSLGLQLAIGNIMYSLGIIFKNTLSVRVTFSSIIDNLDGSIIPYQFLPSKLTNILKYSFLMGIKTIPFAYFLGNSSDFSGILLQTIWLIILIIIGNFILNRVIKRLEVFGG